MPTVFAFCEASEEHLKLNGQFYGGSLHSSGHLTGLPDTIVLYTISHCAMRRDMLGPADGVVDANDKSSNSGTRS